jgi:hypothetical protein
LRLLGARWGTALAMVTAAVDLALRLLGGRAEPPLLLAGFSAAAARLGARVEPADLPLAGALLLAALLLGGRAEPLPLLLAALLLPALSLAALLLAGLLLAGFSEPSALDAREAVAARPLLGGRCVVEWGRVGLRRLEGR